jgi:hypothetical protein
LLNGDNITATFICSAISISPPGSYAITPVLSDPNNRLGSYIVTTSNGTLTVIAGSPPTLLSVTPGSGLTNGGTPVSITGSGFELGASVSFAGQSATSVNVSSGTVLTALTPAGPLGQVNVVLTNPDQSTATLTNGFTYTGPPDLVPISFVAASNSIVFYPPSPQSPTVQVSWTVTNQSTGVASGYWYDAVYVSTNTSISGAISSSSYTAPSPLPGDGEYGQTNTITLPQQSGAYYLILNVNDGHTLYESNYANNMATVPITITYQVQPPDLAPVSFAPATSNVVFYPPSPQAPTVQVNWTVINQGTGVASGSWEDTGYVSTTTNIAGAISSSSYQAPSPVAIGGEYGETNTITLPEQSGAYYLILNVNNGRSLYEGNYANNTATVPITVTYQVNPPDLVPIAVTAPATVIAPQPNPVVSVTWTVTNQGTGTASGTWSDRVWFSTNGVLDANSKDAGDFSENQTVPVGGGYSQTHSVTLPMSSNGNYTLFVQVNVNNALYESNYANNISGPMSGTFTLTPPDLQVISVSMPSQAWTGSQFDATWVVTNSGTGVAVGSWYDRVYLSVTNRLQTNVDQVLGNFLFEGQVQPGQTVQLTQPVTVNRVGITNGYYYLSVVANVSNTLFEVITTNNADTSLSNIYVQVTPLAQLALTSVDAPTNGIGGQPVGVSWVVCNQGQGDTDVPAWYDHLYLSTTTNLSGIVDDYGQYENPSYLAAGDCYEQDVTVTLPVGISGPYYFIVSADSTGEVGEDTGTNIIGSTALPINVQLVTPGFLHVASVQVAPAPPTAVWAGASVTVTWTVQNIGQASITGTWDDEVTLSPTPIYDFVNGYWDVINHIYFTGPLAPGQSYTHTEQFTVPQGITPGNWYAVPIVDTHNFAGGTGAIGSGNIGRDQNSTLVLVSAPPPADLTVTNISAPATAYAGQSINVEWVVNNDGLNGTSSDSWYDGVYLSTNGVFDTNENLLLGSFAHWGALGVGASYTNTGTVTIPADILSPGATNATTFLFVYTDTGNVVLELTKTNNVLEATNPLTILPAPPAGLPALAVTSVSAPSAILAGGPANIFWTVSNVGAGATGAINWVDSVYLSPDGTLNPKTNIWLADIPHDGALAPGASYTVAQSLTFSPCITGSFFIVVLTDSGYQVNESGTGTNNFLSSPALMHILPNNAARIGVSSVTSASGVSAGTPLAVSWTVANSGNSTANAPWIDGVFLSPNPVYVPGNGYLLSLHTNLSNVGPGGSYSQSQPISVPICFSGDYYVTVVADVSNTVDSISCDTNNFETASSPVQIVPVAYPSLQLAGLTVPTSVTSAVPWTVQWSVTNAGTGDASGTWLDAVYASLSNVLTPNALLLGEFEHVGGLPAGTAYSQSQIVQLPACTSGQYYIFAVADVSNVLNSTAVCQPDSALGSTNALTVNFGLYPDLTVSSISIPASASGGQPMAVTWTVTNAGQATASGPWVDSVYLSPNGSSSTANSILLGSYPQANPLQAGVTYTQSASFMLPNVYGSYYIKVFTDASNAVQECQNQANNVAVSTSTVNIHPSIYPDLMVADVQVPATAFAGQPITVTWVVTNEGTDATGSVGWNDAVYLSLDEVLEPSATRLATVPNASGLGVGQSYTNSTTVVIPPGNAGPFYILVLADSGGVLYEPFGYNDSLGFNPNAVLVSLPPTADLAATGVTLAPATGVPGTSMTIGWTVANVAPNATASTWTDAIYLSTNNFWDVTATLLADVNHTGLAALSTYNGSWTGPLPALTPGNYYAIVRADIRNTLPETNLANNTAVSPNTISVDVPVIVLGQTVTNIVATGGAQYYKVNCPAGQTVRITLTGSNTNSANELYARYGAVPDLGDYDFIYNNALAPNQEIDIPGTVAGWYYIMVRGGNEPEGPADYTLLAQTVPFAISQINPNLIGDNGQVTIMLQGALFQPGASVQLVSGGTVYAAQTNIFVNQTSLMARFQLTNAIHGTYDVFLTNPDNSYTTATQAVTIETALLLTAQVIPGLVNSLPRLGTPFNWAGEVANTGNIDIPYLTVSVGIVPNQTFPILLTPPSEAVTAFTNSTSSSAGACAFIARDLPPGQSLDFSFVVSSFGSRFNYYVAPAVQFKQDFLAAVASEAESLRDYANSNADGVVVMTTNTSGAVTTNMVTFPAAMVILLADPVSWENFYAQALVKGGLLDTNDLSSLPPPVAAAESMSVTSKIRTQGLFDCFYCDDIKEFAEKADQVFQLAGIAGAFTACVVNPLTCPLLPEEISSIALESIILDALIRSGYNLCIRACHYQPPVPVCWVGMIMAYGGIGFPVGSVCPHQPKDPNEKLGPTGYSDVGFVGSQVPWLYTVYFENTSNASAFARQVSITDPLDSSLDIRTFRVGNIVVGNTTITVPPNSTYYQTRISLPAPNPSNIVADITAGVDAQSRSLFWTMNAIDLNTGQLVTDTQEGVLPPNTTNNVGAGYVTYSIKPAAGVPTGTMVTNQASIVFDINDPIPTDTTTNTVDAVPPTSFVAPLPSVTASTNFTVSWSGTDDPGGSGVASYTIYYSDDGGPYQVWLANTTSTSAQFTGQFGHTYAFYSSAQDNAGNIETAHATPDTTTFVSSPPVIAPVADQSITVGTALMITNTVTDANIPSPTLTFSLGPDSPEGASINPTNGVFNWRPVCEQGGTTNLIEVMVTTSDNPPQTNSILFEVAVGDCAQVEIGSTVVQTGQSACVPVNLFSTVGLTNLTFTLAYPTNRFSNWAIVPTNPIVGMVRVQVLDPADSFFSLASATAQVFQEPILAGSICLSALPGQSAFVPLMVTNVVATKADGTLVGNTYGQPGLVVVVGAEPLLGAALDTNSSVIITLYGNPGSNYVIQNTSDLRPPISWQPAYTVTMTNLTQLFELGNGSNLPPMQFFRAYGFQAP